MQLHLVRLSRRARKTATGRWRLQVAREVVCAQRGRVSESEYYSSMLQDINASAYVPAGYRKRPLSTVLGWCDRDHSCTASFGFQWALEAYTMYI